MAFDPANPATYDDGFKEMIRKRGLLGAEVDVADVEALYNEYTGGRTASAAAPQRQQSENFDELVPVKNQWLDGFYQALDAQDRKLSATGMTQQRKAELEREWQEQYMPAWRASAEQFGINMTDAMTRVESAKALAGRGDQESAMSKLRFDTKENPDKVVWQRTELARSFNEDGEVSPREQKILDGLDSQIERAYGGAGATAAEDSILGRMGNIRREKMRVQEFISRNAVNSPLPTIYEDMQQISGRGQFQEYLSRLKEEDARLEADLVVGLRSGDPNLRGAAGIINHEDFRRDGRLDMEALNTAISRAPNGAIIWNGNSLTYKGMARPTENRATTGASATSAPNQDLEAAVIDAQAILSNPQASVTERAKAQAEIGSAQKEAARRRTSQERNKEFTDKVERAGAVEAEQQAAREELNVLAQSLTVPQTRETTIGRAREGDARLKVGPLDFDLANYQLPLAGRVRNPSVDDETFQRGLQRMAQLRVTLGEDEDEVLKELGLPRQSLAMVRSAPASGRGR